MIVAIDGPAGSGKSTVAERAAQAVHFGYLDSGMLYRGISRAVLDSGQNREDEDVVVRIAGGCRFSMRGDELLLDGRALEGIQSESIDHWSARHSSILEVRRIVNRQIRRIVGERDFIVMGRDIGTVVFPHARLKIYLDASLQARAARRSRQNRQEAEGSEPKRKSETVSDQARVRRDLQQRDSIDRDKPFGRLAQARDALYIDTSDLTIGQVCDRVVREILKTKNQYGD